MQRVEIRGKQSRLVEPTLCNRVPSLAPKNLSVDLTIPKNFKRLPLSVIINTRKPY